eukprot:3125526-Rhodomonas_salina.2
MGHAVLTRAARSPGGGGGDEGAAGAVPAARGHGVDCAPRSSRRAAPARQPTAGQGAAALLLRRACPCGLAHARVVLGARDGQRAGRRGARLHALRRQLPGHHPPAGCHGLRAAAGPDGRQRGGGQGGGGV